MGVGGIGFGGDWYVWDGFEVEVYGFYGYVVGVVGCEVCDYFLLGVEVLEVHEGYEGLFVRVAQYVVVYF